MKMEIVKYSVVAVIFFWRSSLNFHLHLDAKYGKGTAEELLQYLAKQL
jgi:hypothetical protein